VLFAHFAGYGHEARVVLYLATLMTIFGLVAEPMQAGFQAIERMEYLAYTDVINKTAQSLVGIALALVGLGAVGIISDMTVAAGVLILLNAYWLRRFLRVDLRTSARMIRRVFRGSLVYWATGTFSMIYLWIDTLMLSLITHPRQVGWYGVTTNLFQTFLFVPVMVSTAWLPRLVSAFAGGKDRVVEAARAPLELVLVIGIPLASLITMASPLMIHLLYGPAYGHAVPVMIVLAACLPWMSLNIILSSIFVAMKRASVWTFVMVGAALVNPLFNLVLIPATVNRFHNGAIGAGAALVLTELLMDLVGMALIGRQVLSRSSLTRWLTATLVSAAALVPAFLTRGLGSGASLAIGATVLIALLIPCRVVTVEQLTFLRSMAQARWRRLRGRGGPGLAVAND
jgi:O-antigen/teichoic acid export membrane protein